MGKIYSSDREICLISNNDSGSAAAYRTLPEEFTGELNGLFDRNGFFQPRRLRESAETRESLYKDLSRSNYRELRYLGLSGLMALEKESYDSLFWEAFYDSFYPVRGLVIDNLNNRERTRLFNEIFKKLTGDPRQVIREKAYRRIKKDFADLFSFRINNFPAEEQYRLIMFLDSHAAQDFDSLSDFIEGDDNDLASRALYRIQLEEGKSINRWPEKTGDLSLIRVSTLSSYCHGGLEHFPTAFQLIDEHTPPGLASQYISELLKKPYRHEWSAFYRKAALLIGKMKGPTSKPLLEQLYKNRELWKKIGKDMAAAFTRNNQYYTADLLARILSDNREGLSETGIPSAADGFSFPLN